MKIAWKRVPNLIFAELWCLWAILFISVVTIWLYFHWTDCWVAYDTFCFTDEKSRSTYKIAALLSQLFGVAILLVDVNSKVAALKNESLWPFMTRNFRVWRGRFFIQEKEHAESYINSENKSGSKMNSMAISGDIGNRVSRLERLYAEVLKDIDSCRDSLKEHKKEVNDLLDAHKNESMQGMQNLRSAVESAHLGNISRPLFSMYLMLYAAVLNFIS